LCETAQPARRTFLRRTAGAIRGSRRTHPRDRSGHKPSYSITSSASSPASSAAAGATSVQLISDGECFQDQVRDRIGM
jgi:hypothetical protein